MKNIINTPAKAALAVVGAILVLVLVVGGTLFGMFNSVQKDGTAREAALNVQYLDNQNELSSYIATIKETLGVADRKTDKLDEILSEAVKGRYEGRGGTNVESSALTIAAITEAYPDLAGLDSYDKVMDQISAGRDAYKNKQTKLLDMLGQYDTFKNSGLIKSRIVAMVGFPSGNLRAGDERGQDALDKMYDIVLVEEAREAYETGEMPVLDTNPGSED